MRSLLTASTLALAVAIVSFGASAPAHAADMPEYPPVIDTPEPLPLPAAGGWYLRGDIGYKIYNNPSASLSNVNYADGQYLDGKANFINESLDGAVDLGVGAGYKFNDYLRADLTLDYETPAGFKGKLWCPDACGTANYSSEAIDITAWSGLVNAYVDLGTYYGITPYIGAGVGASYLVTDGGKSSDGTKYDGAGNWNFAWALQAGASYAINPQWSVDLGYRYLNLGDAKSGQIGPDANDAYTRVDYKNIDAHEVRLGLRYNLF